MRPSESDLYGMALHINSALAYAERGELDQARAIVQAAKMLIKTWYMVYGSFPGLLAIEEGIGKAERACNKARGEQA